MAVPGGHLHYLDWGGPGIQTHLLHANGFCAGIYTPLVKYFTADLHIVASDIRGHGDSNRTVLEPIRHWEVFANDLKRLVEGVMTPPVVGIGHSLGAVSTLIAAATYPHLFSRIVLMDPVVLHPATLALIGLLRSVGLGGLIPLARGARRRKQMFQNKAKAFQRFAAGRGIFKTWSREFIHAYLECGLLEKDAETAVLKCDPEVEAQIFESVPGNVWRYVRRVACPVLVIRGEHSDAFPAASARRMRERRPDWEIRTLPETGHFFPMEKPAACAKIILEFAAGSGKG